MMAELMVTLATFKVAFFVVTFAALMLEFKTALMLKMVMALGTMVVVTVSIKKGQKLSPPLGLLIYTIHN